jgi:membrane dipeptidase
VSQWPNLIARLLARGVSDEHAKMVAGDNILRAWAQIEEVAKAIQKEEQPNEETWEDRLWEPEYPGTPRLFPPKK